MERKVFGILLLAFCAKFQLGASQHINATRKAFTEEAESAALVKFRRVLPEGYLYEEYMRTDAYLIRWVRNQDLDVEKAKEKLISSLKWRKQNRVDSVLGEGFSDIIKQCPFDLSGRDKKGLPFLTASLGQCHIRRIVLKGKLDKLNRAIIYLMESMSKIGRLQQSSGDKNSVQWTVIADMSGLSYREHTCLTCLPFFIHMMEVYLNHYPDLFKDIYVINMTRIAIAFINTLRYLEPISHQESLYSFGFDKNEWQEALLSKVDANQLTPSFGGTKG